MIVDCATNKQLSDNDRIVWILVVVLTHWIGALIYLIVTRNNSRNSSDNPLKQPPTPPPLRQPSPNPSPIQQPEPDDPDKKYYENFGKK